MDVLIGGTRVSIEQSVFVELFENSVVSERATIVRAMETSEIRFADLVKHARMAEIPYPLFFAPPSVVHAQVEAKTRKLMQGVAPDTFTVNTRTTIRLSDVELIIKDLLRKQALLKKHDATLRKNSIVGLLRTPGATARHDAQVLVDALGLDRERIWAAGTKSTALERIIECLEAKQILVSRSVQHYMPQFVSVHFSGMTIRDAKVPYIFLAGGDHGDNQEPAGRQIFTLVLMAVLVARGVFAPVSYNASSIPPNSTREYDIVGEILMPGTQMRQLELQDLDAVKSAADRFKVTPSAMAVRAMRLGTLSADAAEAYLRALEIEFTGQSKPRMQPPKPVNAVRKYNGRELTRRLLQAVDERKLPEREFCRVVCLKHLGPEQLGELRTALG